MKRILRNSVAVLLAVLMMFEAGGTGIVYAAEEVDRIFNPAEHIELRVPEKHQNGKNLFFIEKADWSVSEKSSETLYIPIQRVGALDMEADVTLKVVDLSAKHDVNYTAEIYKETVEPETFLTDQSIKEIALTADEQEEFQPGTESDLGAAIHAAGGATFVDGEGNPVAEVTATPLDENGNPVVEEPAPVPLPKPRLLSSPPRKSPRRPFLQSSPRLPRSSPPSRKSPPLRNP